MKLSLVSLFILVFSFQIFAQDEEKNYDEAFKLIEVWLDAQRDYDQLPGISAAVIDDQEVLWSGAFGIANQETGAKTDISTLCSICSISKLFTSVAIMKLYDEGKLSLEDKVDDLLPFYDLKQQYPESGPVTIRSLLTHSSGLPRESAHPYWSWPDFPFPSSEDVREGLESQQTLYPASTYYQYSNLGMTLLGEIVAQVSGMSFEDYVAENILDPLSLSDTKPEMAVDQYGEELALGYSAITRKGDRKKVKFFNADGIAAAAGFTSNVVDLGKFASWQFRLRDSTITEILKPSTLKYMQQVHYMDPSWETTRGLGFAIYKGDNGTTWAGHGGSCPGYRSTLQLDLENKKAYTAMINAGGTNPNKYTKGIRQILKKVEKIKEPEEESSESTVDLEEYTGYYNLQPWWSEQYVSTWNGNLVIIRMPTENPGNSLNMYKHIEGDTFRRIRDNEELGEELIFSRDPNGKVYRLAIHGTYTDRIEAPDRT